jgi:hypothetical protein
VNDGVLHGQDCPPRRRGSIAGAKLVQREEQLDERGVESDSPLQGAPRGAETCFMSTHVADRGRAIAAVAIVGMLVGSAMVFAFLASRETPAPGTMVPFASIYHDPLSKLDVALTGGDGHAFAVIAQDPTLSRPSVLREPAEFAYRAQRPVWGYLTWAASGGQSRFTGWTLVVLVILSCGAACAITALLLAERGRSVWWAIVVPFVGFETLTEMTPELFALALVGAGVLLWRRDRRLLAVAVFCVAVLTRETVLVAIGGLALWDLLHATGDVRARLGRVVPLAVPLLVYTTWIAFLRARLGNWPFHHSGERLSLPGAGLAHALEVSADSSAILFWVVIAVLLCAAAVWCSPHDVLTWIAFAYLGFATMLGTDVWVTNAGFQRALLPLYVFATIGALRYLDLRARASARLTAEPGLSDQISDESKKPTAMTRPTTTHTTNAATW